MIDDSKYNSNVIASILASNNFGILKVCNLESIKSAIFNFTEYSMIEECIKNENFTTIKDSKDHASFREYLEIMQFSDQNNKRFLVTVYDSDELWQDPKLIKVYQANV